RLTAARDEREARRRLRDRRLGELETRRVEVEQLHREVLEATRAGAASFATPPRKLSPIDHVVAVAVGPASQPDRPRDWRGYARWLMPSISVALLMLVMALGIGFGHHGHKAPSVVQVNGSKIIAAPAAGLDSGRAPRGGFLSQSEGGRVIPPTGVPGTRQPGSSPAGQTALGGLPPRAVRDP